MADDRDTRGSDTAPDLRVVGDAVVGAPPPSLGRLIARTALVADAAAHRQVNADLRSARTDAGSGPTIVDGSMPETRRPNRPLRARRPPLRRRWLWPFP